MKKKRLMDYTAGYRVLIVLGILCSAGEAVLELLLPQIMSDIVDIGIKNADRNYILMAGLKMVIMALVSLALGVGAAVLASKAGMASAPISGPPSIGRCRGSPLPTLSIFPRPL